MKKRHFKLSCPERDVNNVVFTHLSGATEWIEQDYETAEDNDDIRGEVEWVITEIWMTDEEYQALVLI